MPASNRKSLIDVYDKCRVDQRLPNCSSPIPKDNIDSVPQRVCKLFRANHSIELIF